jgi:hypothetical protein
MVGEVLLLLFEWDRGVFMYSILSVVALRIYTLQIIHRSRGDETVVGLCVFFIVPWLYDKGPIGQPTQRKAHFQK